MNKPFWILVTPVAFLCIGCSKPYSEAPRIVTPEGNTYQIINVKKENYLPIYYTNEINENIKFIIVKELITTWAQDPRKPIPTKERLNEALSYDAYKNNANAIIIRSIGPGVLNKNKDSMSFAIVATLIRIQK